MRQIERQDALVFKASADPAVWWLAIDGGEGYKGQQRKEATLLEDILFAARLNT